MTEHHHKVLRRLLHLLAATSSNSLSPEAGSQAISYHADSPPAHQQGVGRQQNTDSVKTPTSLPAVPDKSAEPVADATAALPSLSEPTAPSALPQPSAAAASPAAAAASHIAATCTPSGSAVLSATQQYEQICKMVRQARQPAVKREGLHCLGAAMQCLTAALTPTKNQQHSQTAGACSDDEQPADPQLLNRYPRAQEPGQTAGSSTKPEQAGRGNSGMVEALLKSSLHEAELSDSGLDPAHLREATTSQNTANPQMTATAQPEPGASQAQQGEREDEQTAYCLVDGFVALVSTYSEAQQFDDMRLAAATALAASGSHCTSSNACMVPACMLGSQTCRAGSVLLALASSGVYRGVRAFALCGPSYPSMHALSMYDGFHRQPCCPLPSIIKASFLTRVKHMAGAVLDCLSLDIGAESYANCKECNPVLSILSLLLRD